MAAGITVGTDGATGAGNAIGAEKAGADGEMVATLGAATGVTGAAGVSTGRAVRGGSFCAETAGRGGNGGGDGCVLCANNGTAATKPVKLNAPQFNFLP